MNFDNFIHHDLCSVFVLIAGKTALAKNSNYLKELLEKLKDRFGAPPEETSRLIEIMELKVLAKKLSVTKIQNTAGRIKIIFAPETEVTHQKILSIYENREKIP